ncbi:hypothetical protein A2U01_0029912 [Trifolium medium]|uniref:Uncharacterized protein n=1 Tax=Trifolium medium TaxID=97028 RepID=A0A392P9M6_9FABA|nr:hypothetical protein [Trifolium medium]
MNRPSTRKQFTYHQLPATNGNKQYMTVSSPSVLNQSYRLIFNTFDGAQIYSKKNPILTGPIPPIWKNKQPPTTDAGKHRSAQISGELQQPENVRKGSRNLDRRWCGWLAPTVAPPTTTPTSCSLGGGGKKTARFVSSGLVLAAVGQMRKEAAEHGCAIWRKGSKVIK